MPEYESWVEYRPIEGFLHYLVGSDGSIWTNIICRQRSTQQKAFETGAWRRIKSCPDPRGYHIVTLYPTTGRRVSRMVHTLVLATFIGKAQANQQCRHRNGRAWDNALENLTWGTAAENAQDRILHGTTPKGVKNGGAKLTREHIEEIRRLKTLGKTHAELVNQFGVSFTTVYRIVSRRNWT